MLCALLAASALVADPVDTILDRYVRRYAGAKSFRARFAFTPPGQSKIIVTYEVRRPSRQRLEFVVGGKPFIFTQNGRDIMEIDHASRTYDVGGTPEEWGFPLGEINDLAGYLYPMFYSPAFVSSFRQNFEMKVMGKAIVQRRETTRLRGEAASDMGQVFREMSIDSQGILWRLEAGNVVTGTGPSTIVELEEIVFDPALPDERFEVAIPDGFAPRRTPFAGWPLSVGSKLPDLRWNEPGKTAKIDARRLFPGRYWLLLVTTPGCMPSQRGAKDWLRLRDEAAKFGAGFVELSLGKSTKPLGPWKLFQDGGDFDAKVNPPGTPFLMLIDRGGAIEGLWYGYDSSAFEALFKDVRGLLGPD